MATTIPSSTPQSSSAVTSTSDIAGTTHNIHNMYEVTTNSPSGTTPHLPSVNVPTTTYLTERTTESNHQFTTVAAVTQTGTSSSPFSPTSKFNDGHEGTITTADSTNHSEITTVTATTTSQTDDQGYSSESTTEMVSGPSSGDLSVTTVAELQAKQDKYNIWESSQHNLLQVAIVSLTVLFIVCIAVCIMMVTLFFTACKRRKVPFLQITRGRYKKLSPIETEQEETHTENETQEYSFMEI